MIVGIIGIGLVGGSIRQSFMQKNIKIISYDIADNTIDTLDECIHRSAMIFLCLPTPYNETKQCFDKSAINDVCHILCKKKYTGIVILKSTVEPTTTSTLVATYNLNIVHNPEFLTARTAFVDFHNQKQIILGNPDNQNSEYIDRVLDFYSKYYPEAEIILCNSTESELVKLAVNSFYAVKIQYFNEIYHLCNVLKCDYESVKLYMLKQKWINPMHTNVPGHDGKLSFGGACFPKDIRALCTHMKNMNISRDVIDGCIMENTKDRKDASDE